MNKFLFTWEESYSLTQELSKWKAGFLQKFGEQGLFEFKGDNVDLGVIQNTVMWWGMFSEKKLILIHWVPKENDPAYKIPAWIQNSVEEWLIKSRDSIPQDHIVALVCHKPDKRTKWWKFFEKNAEKKQFDPLKPNQIASKVSSLLWPLVKAPQASLIAQLVWTNMRNIVHECEKLSLYASYHQLSSLTDEVIKDIVYHQGDVNAFGLLDTLFTDKSKAIQTITDLQQSQQDIFQTTWMLYRGLKIIIQITDCLKRWITSSKEIASAIKAPPFAVSKQLKNRDLYLKNDARITWFFWTIMSLDHAIKTGRLPAEWFWVSLKSAVYGI